MRKLLLLPLLAAFLLTAPGALAATKTVSITNSAFVPNAVSIEVGDAVTWTNSDSRNRQPISQDAGFASPILKPGETYTYTFKADGKFTVTDALVKSQRSSVTVAKPAPALGAPSLSASRTKVVYGASIVLTGKVPTAKAGEKVTLRGEVLTPAGTRQATAVTESSTTADGVYTFTVVPSAQTTYTVAWQATPATSSVSAPVSVRVAPRIGLGIVRTAGRYVTFSTKATSAVGYAGKSVYLQRRNALGQWVSLKRVVLRSSTVATRTTVRLPRGLSRIRVLMPQAQVGLGYVTGVSRVVLLAR
jgi:plastocyanin